MEQDTFAVILAVCVIVIALGFAIASFTSHSPSQYQHQQHTQQPRNTKCASSTSSTETLQDSTVTSLVQTDDKSYVSVPIKQPQPATQPLKGEISLKDPSLPATQITQTMPTPANDNRIFAADIKQSYMLNIEPTDALIRDDAKL